MSGKWLVKIPPIHVCRKPGDHYGVGSAWECDCGRIWVLQRFQQRFPASGSGIYRMWVAADGKP